MSNNDEVLLRVEHLCQYFKMGRAELKAVDDASFEIKKGEVFGLVGESGCGKTTTGRSIIRLYNITGGDVYFDGQRIGAGLRLYKNAIKEARRVRDEELAALAKVRDDELAALGENVDKNSPQAMEITNRYNAEAERVKAHAAEIIQAQRHQIHLAKHDQKRCDKDHAARLVDEVNRKYDELVAAASEAEKPALETKRKEEVRLARRERLTTQIQMIFQDPIASLDPRMTVREIIAEGLIIKGIRDKHIIDEKVYEVLEMVGLVKEHATRYPHEFSGGQRQRIGVARAVIMQPKLIIADEPISALDVSIQAQVINLLNDLRHNLGLTILFIAHDLSVVKYFSDRIAVMYFGKIVELTTSDELFAHPLHPYTRSLLSAIPLPDPIYEKQRKRIVYNPLAEHDYSTDKPSLQEVGPGHFVYCNAPEFAKYAEILAADAAPKDTDVE